MVKVSQIKKGTGHGGARRGSGRKPYTKKRTRRATVHLPEVFVDELEIEAQREGKSRSHLVYELLEPALKDHRRKKRLGKQGKRLGTK